MELRHIGEELWILIKVNPEPWTVGTLGTGRRNNKVFPTISKDAGLVTFQEAVKEELSALPMPIMPVELEVKFFFWRNLATYRTPTGRTHTKHVVDATNMQKSTEDALQGVLFDNDRNNRQVSSVIVEQGTEVVGRILICVKPADIDAALYETPMDMLAASGVMQQTGEINTDLTRDPGDIF